MGFHLCQLYIIIRFYNAFGQGLVSACEGRENGIIPPCIGDMLAYLLGMREVSSHFSMGKIVNLSKSAFHYSERSSPE